MNYSKTESFAEEGRQSQVTDWLSRLQAEVDLCLNTQEEVEKRLSPVTRDDALPIYGGVPGEAPEACLVPVAEKLRTLTKTVSAITRRNRGLLEKLEV